MKKSLFLLVAILLLTHSAAAANSACVMLKFTDDTRFYKIGSADMLSELVMEKLIMSGKFRLKETRPLDPEAEKLLYDDKAALRQNVEIAVETGNYDALFEGEGFNERKAKSIGAAKRGQTVSPEIIKAIGQSHNADYIIQGNIANIGTGDQLKINAVGQVGALLAGLGSYWGSSGLKSAGDIFGGMTTEKKTLGVVVALRLIDTRTGEVVWDTQVLGKSAVKLHATRKGDVKVGTGSMSGDTLEKALDDAAEGVVKALTEDISAHKLLIR